MKKLSLAILFLGALALGACSGEGGDASSGGSSRSTTTGITTGGASTTGGSSTSTPAHVHTFSNEWASDETHHWHPATCGHSVVDGKATHTVGEDDFCSVCGRFLGHNFSLTDQGGYADFVHEQMNLGENEIYYCRLAGAHSGHIFELEDGDPRPSLDSALSAYTFIGGVKTAVPLDGNTQGTISDDGYLYISIDASLLTDRNDIWFRILENCIPPVSPTFGTLSYLGFCPIDGKYIGSTHNVNADMSPTIEQGKFVYRRVTTTADSEYGLWATFNDHIENTSKVEAFAIVNNAPVLLATGFDYDMHLLHFPENASDNHIYLVFSYVGTQPTAALESVSVKSLSHGCDNNRWFYGDVVGFIGDSTDLEGRSINGKYYVGFLPDDPDDDAYEIYLDGALSYSMGVYQDNNTAVVALEANGLGYYLPTTAEPIIIEIETSTPGSQIDVFVVKHAR